MSLTRTYNTGIAARGRIYYATDSKIGSGSAETHDPLLPLMGFGLPDMAQLIYKLSVSPSSAGPSGKSGNALPAGTGIAKALRPEDVEVFTSPTT